MSEKTKWVAYVKDPNKRTYNAMPTNLALQILTSLNGGKAPTGETSIQEWEWSINLDYYTRDEAQSFEVDGYEIQIVSE